MFMLRERHAGSSQDRTDEPGPSLQRDMHDTCGWQYKHTTTEMRAAIDLIAMQVGLMLMSRVVVQ
jgi:hypothetical protein